MTTTTTTTSSSLLSSNERLAAEDRKPVVGATAVEKDRRTWRIYDERTCLALTLAKTSGKCAFTPRESCASRFTQLTTVGLARHDETIDTQIPF
ncbi:hypothetical protein K0M31_020364 [Melipona bicolor]|uniref:Uncharacterized protein n=1 Tax=Melipona bicolor TaxID=60889 RepID=A0AA40KQW2_9HYME|nr:hypothetical protein K0M31_020364 [Melipona bicolor]